MYFKTNLSKNTLQYYSFKISPLKNAFQNCYHNFFISASINAVKVKIGINKSLIMYDLILTIHYLTFIIFIKVGS